MNGGRADQSFSSMLSFEHFAGALPKYQGWLSCAHTLVCLEKVVT